VKIAKGFKGKYFSLSAIAATSGNAVLHAKEAGYVQHLPRAGSRESETESPPPLDEIELIACPLDFRRNPVAKKACHCSILFLQRTLHLFHRLRLFVIKLCPCRKTKTGLAPPLLFSTL
jgi:hypothetical protein